MVAVQQPLPMLQHDRPEPELAFDQRQIPHVLAVEPQQIESIEPGHPTPEQQVSELRLAMAVEVFLFPLRPQRASGLFSESDRHPDPWAHHGRGSFGWRGDGRDFSWKGSATLEGTAQQKGCRVCGKRPVLIQLYQYIYTDSYSSW